MNKHYFGCETINLETNEEVELKYYLISTEKFIEEVKEIRTIYGIEIEKHQSDNEAEFERSLIDDISLNEEYTINILDKLKDNQVSPMHLYDIMENLI